MHKIKILFFIDCLLTGGKERRLTELMKSLQFSKDIDFELVVMNEEIHFKEVLTFGKPIHYLIRSNKKDLSVFYKFYKLCKEIKPDIVHSWDNMTAVYASAACTLLSIKFINGMITDTMTNKSFRNKYWVRARLTFPFSDRIIANSMAGLKSYEAPKSRSSVIYNGFNFNRIENLLPSETIRTELLVSTEIIVGMVASYSPFKDYKSFLKAAELVLKNNQNIIFLLIGNGTDSNEVKQMISAENKTKFRFLGKKYGVESYINIMDVCVLSSFSEGISNSIIEYMALKKPVVATIGGGTSELIEDMQTGFLIKQGDANTMKEKIELLIQKPELRSQMGEKGKKRIEDLFSIDVMKQQYILLYQELDSAKNSINVE